MTILSVGLKWQSTTRKTSVLKTSLTKDTFRSAIIINKSEQTFDAQILIKLGAYINYKILAYSKSSDYIPSKTVHAL